MPAETLDNNLGYVGHVWFDLLERSPDAPDPWSDGEPDLAWTEEPAMRMGFSWFYTQIEATAAGEFARPRTVDRGATVASLVLPLGVTQFSLAQQGIDVGYKFRGLSVWSEYFFRQIDDYRGAALSDLFDHGMYVQAGYFIVPKHLELAARYSVLWGNSGTLGASYAESSEIAAGFTYYIRGHYIKLVSDITLLDGAPINNPTPNIRAGEDGVLWRSQFQLAW